LSFQRTLESYQDHPSRKQTKTLSLTNNHQPPTTNFFASAPFFLSLKRIPRAVKTNPKFNCHNAAYNLCYARWFIL
jgi:hypothetical protein